MNYSKKFFLEKTSYPKQYEEELENLNSRESGPQPEIITTEAPYVKILDIINENRDKKIGVITRKNHQIIKISKFLDFHNVKYVTTSSQATTKKARDEITKFLLGVLSDEKDAKISSLFTFFSPNSLKDAFEITEKYKNKESFSLPEIYSSNSELTKALLEEIFQKVIFPISISRGSEWLSTVQSVKSQIDEYFTMENPTVEGLFDFIKIVEESYVDSNEESNVTLTSVHKSKGRTFDIVVYYPSKKRASSFIDPITESILLSNDIDVEDEIEEESLRIDFVAFTRAAKKLIVLVDDKTKDEFVIDDASTLTVDPTDKKQQDVTSFSDFKLAEAYSLFVAGKFDDAKKLLNQTDDWLIKYIHNYFNKLDNLSYSAIKLTNSYDFLKSRIMKVPTYSQTSSGGFGAEFGDALHKDI